jgi:hypothetical protein
MRQPKAEVTAIGIGNGKIIDLEFSNHWSGLLFSGLST